MPLARRVIEPRHPNEACRARRHRCGHEAGIALLIALVTSIALAYAALALIRASTATASVGANVHARRQAALAASIAVERAVVALVRDRVIDPFSDDVARNYFASRQAGEDRQGVPRALQSIANYPESAPIIDVAGGYRVRYLIERLCVAPGDATADNCTLSPPSIEAARGTPAPGEPPRVPSYRVSARVDAEAGGVAQVQAIVSLVHANPRLSWRLLDE